MQHTEQRRQVHINIETQACELPRDELPRIDQPLNDVMDVLGDMPGELKIKIIFHPHRQEHHVKAALSLPRRTLFTGDWDSYLDTALLRAIRKLKHKAAAYRTEPDHVADEVAERIEQMNRDIIAPENADMGPLGEAVASGDYRAFRSLLGGHEDWLRLRVGRWLERYPDAEAEVGRRVKIGDLVEEVLLTAFERYEGRSNDVPLHEWIDSLIDPALQTYCQHPVEERENISLVRSLTAPQAPPKTPKQKSPAMAARKKKKSKRKWSAKIHTVSTFPPEGTFKKDASSVARIMASKKVSPKGIGSGIRMITMYINRAGKNLDPAQRKELEKAKHILQEKANAEGQPKATRKSGKRRASRKKESTKSAKARSTARKKTSKKKTASGRKKKARR